MAQPVPFRKFVPTDTKDEIVRQVENAPKDHGDALLSSLKLLQELHDTGTLDLLRGLVGRGDAVVNHVVNIISTPEMIDAMRNLLALGTLLTAINPDELHIAIQGKSEDRKSKPPSLFALSKQMNTEEARLGISAAVGLLTAFGGAIKKERAKASE
jgi:uncharacterized protein YjgD (DUF1641 family)